MKKNIIGYSLLLFFGAYNASLYAEKTYTFINFLNSDLPSKCARCKKGIWPFYRYDTETACDDLEEKLKKCYETGKNPPKLHNAGAGWGIVEMIANGDNGYGSVKKILVEGEQESFDAEKIFREFYNLECFLAENSLVHPIGRTLEEWKESREERLARLKKIFHEKSNRRS